LSCGRLLWRKHRHFNRSRTIGAQDVPLPPAGRAFFRRRARGMLSVPRPPGELQANPAAATSLQWFVEPIAYH
jgi:hypothetical protein